MEKSLLNLICFNSDECSSMVKAFDLALEKKGRLLDELVARTKEEARAASADGPARPRHLPHIPGKFRSVA